MDESLLHELLAKYRAGTLTAAEKQQLDQWYDTFDTGDTAKDAPDALDPFAVPGAEAAARARLLQRIEVSMAAGAPAGGRSRSIYRYVYAAAAALLVLLVSVPLYRWLNPPEASPVPSYLSAATQPGNMKKLQLSDGSQVWLNAASSLRFPVVFADSSREIWLTAGEAFFDITADNKRPFIVHTGKLTVRVLGTSFNIRAYTQLEQVSIGVASGKVQVMDTAASLGVLTASRQLSWDRASGTVAIKDQDATRIGTWKDGLIRLDGASFNELGTTIKNIYGYTLKTSRKSLQLASYTGTFRNTNSINDVMKMICRMQQSQFEKKDSIIILY